MSNTVLKPQDGAKILLNRGYLETPTYTQPKFFRVGISNPDITVVSTGVTNPIPIQVGTVCADGADSLTGSTAGVNSTDNTDIFKPGAGVFDNTAQNLLKNDTNVTAVWTIANLATNGTNLDEDKRVGAWIYVKDTITLDKIETVTLRLGQNDTNYYTLIPTNLSTGWNWVSSNTQALSELTAVGTPTGTLQYFAVVIVTENATDEFAAGDVVFDLLRQWTFADTQQTFVTGYPQINETNLEVRTRKYLNVLQATGFNFNAISIINEDSQAKASILSKLPTIDKSPTEELIIVTRERILL